MFSVEETEDKIAKMLKTKAADKILLKGYDRETKKAVYRTPKLVRGFIIPKNYAESREPEFPFICLRAVGIESININRQVYQLANFEIYFGCYCDGVYSEDGCFLEDGSGYRDLWNIIEKTRQVLFCESIAMGLKIREESFSAEIPSEQAYPEWIGIINTGFYILKPQN